MTYTKKTRKATPRKSRTRTRKKKPKYVSLRLQLSPQTDFPPSTARVTRQRHKQEQEQQQHQIPVFVEDIHDDHVAMLFDASTDNTASSLHGILENSNTATAPTQRKELLSPYACVEEGSRLVRTAMRCKERDSSEEKWVCYAEVVEEIKKEQEEVSSCCCATADHQYRHHHDDSWWKDLDHERRSGGSTPLVLKLDYQEILNAWSDKGPLYVDEQVVPVLHGPINASTDSLGSVASLWSVPEVGCTKMKEESGAKEGWKVAQREASMLRYKEKRQNRLFSKRIRYEIRKLNAEKRPRIKGRFVKRTEEE